MPLPYLVLVRAKWLMELTSNETLLKEIEALKRRWQRERIARLEAESIAERSLRELYEKKEQLQLVGAVAVAANQLSTLDEVLRLSLQKVCEASSWQLGHAYLAKRDADEVLLLSSQIWSPIETAWMETFHNATEALEFARKGSLPFRALISGEPAWFAGLSTDDCTVGEALRLCPVSSCFVFPVLVDGQVAAVLEFVSQEIIEPDIFFHEVMGQIGAQLARLISRQRLEEQLRYDASHDSLTKLPNRALFMDRLTRAIARKKRFPDAAFALLFIDLDRFKSVNDTYGHNAGDELLIEAATRISAELRSEEMMARYGTLPIPDHEILARLGGDEFTVLLDDPHDPSQAMSVARRIQEAMALPFRIHGNDVFVYASVGVTTSAVEYGSPSEVLQDADVAMYRAKALGGSCCIMYEASLLVENTDIMR